MIMASAGARGSGARQSLRTLVCPGQGRPWALSCARLGLWPWGAAGATLALRGEGPGHGARPRQSKAHSGGPGHRGWQAGDRLVRVAGSDHAPVPLCPPPGEKSCHLSLAPEVLGAQEAAGRDRWLTSCLLWGPHGWPPARASALPSPYGGQEACVGQGGPRWLWGGEWTPGLTHQAAGEPQAAVDLRCGPRKGQGVAQNGGQSQDLCVDPDSAQPLGQTEGLGTGRATPPTRGRELSFRKALCRLRGRQRPAPSAAADRHSPPKVTLQVLALPHARPPPPTCLPRPDPSNNHRSGARRQVRPAAHSRPAEPVAFSDY